MFRSGCVLVPVLIFLFFLLQVFNIFYINRIGTLSSLASNRFTFRCTTKLSNFVIIILILFLSFFPSLLSLFYSFLLSFSPIVFFLYFLYLCFQILENRFHLFILGILIDFSIIKEVQEFINLFLLLLLSLLLCQSPLWFFYLFSFFK